jgi:hypothetical protein
MHRRGEGTAVDLARARRYFDDAAVARHLFAQRAVAGEMLRGRRGVLGVLRGGELLVKTLVRIFLLAKNDPHDERLVH